MHRFLLAALVAAVACDSHLVNPDRCFRLVAQVTPLDPRLNVGDTVTMHAAFYPNVPRECLPPDTTAAGLRWISGDSAIVAVDDTLGRLTGVGPGVAQIMLVPAGSGGGVLGTTFAHVVAPNPAPLRRSRQL